MRSNIRINSTLSRGLKTALVMGSLTVVAIGGCSSSEEKRRASELAGGCSINSDCEEDLICAFERCHVACTEDRDCDADLRCVKSETTSVFVCQLEDETVCKADKDCPGESQVCGVDQECRDACEEDDDCVGNQICAQSNECASTDASKDRLDPEGNIIPDGDTAGGSGSGGNSGSSGSGTGGTGATSSEGGTSTGGVLAEPTAGDGSGGTEPIGAGGEAGSGAGNEGGGPNLPTVEFEETDGPETVNNDDPEHAIPIAQSARFYTGDSAEHSDDDWFSYQAPDDGRAHNLELVLDQDQLAANGFLARAGEDFWPILEGVTAQGTTFSLHVTVGPNTTTLFQFAYYGPGGSKGFTHLTLTDQVEQDEYEPNNTRLAAKTIELGDSVVGQLLNPWVSNAVRPNQDWFAVELETGTATFTFASLPSEARASVYLVPPTTTAESKFWDPPVGGIQATQELAVTTAGTHYFSIRPWNAAAVAGQARDVEPSHFDEQYSFTITQ